MLDRIRSNDLEEAYYTRRKPTNDSVLQVVRASGSTVSIDPSDWKLDRKRNRLYFITHNDDALDTAHAFVRNDPPETAHIPMGTLTAAENTAKKTEQIARSPMNIVRYSVVTNTSDNPDCVNEFTAGVIELWIENADRRFWPKGALGRLLP